MKRGRFQSGDRGVNYNEYFDNDVPLASVPPKRENQIVAQVQEGDTLQAICLRYNCSLAELKRINKIEKEIEIHARSTLKIPVTPYTVLLDTLPGVHSSGNSSPKQGALQQGQNANLLLDNNAVLDEKLLIASVSNAAPGTSTARDTINDIILDSTLAPKVGKATIEFRDEPRPPPDDLRVPLLSGEVDDNVPQPRPIPVRHRFEVSFNGTDCDMSWVCLFICILLLCVAIPLIYVFWTVEHTAEHQHLLENSTLGGDHEHHLGGHLSGGKGH